MIPPRIPGTGRIATRINDLDSMMSSPILRPCVLVAATILLLAAGTAFGQAGATTGVIRGEVLDPLGNPVPGAVVVITNRDTDLVTTVECSPSGVFVRSLLPPGIYDVLATGEGSFGAGRIQGAILRIGEVLDLRFDLTLVTSEAVTVFGELPSVVDRTDATRSQRIREEVVDAVPSNGRNFLDLALLTPGASISQGPDGDELNINGQRGIFNNFIVDGADFNNPFFGEQRGGQRPAFTFNRDAIAELVIVNQGASAEFGRSSGGFIHIVTKSGTNELGGSAHGFSQWDGVAAPHPAERGGGKPEFHRVQTGATLGGPLVQDRAFFFAAWDQQAAAETKQQVRQVRNPARLETLDRFLQDHWPGLFEDEFGPIHRTDDARAFLAKLDFNASDRHQASLKYNFSRAEQVNGSFDVDSWGASANGIERVRSHAVNGSLRSLLANAVSNELRIQWAREDRPRLYEGPVMPGATLPPGPPSLEVLGGLPFPDITMDFEDGFRIGLPFFLPIDPSFDERLQVVENLSAPIGNHLLKVGLEYNRTRAEQQFIGLAAGRYIFYSVDGFIGFATHGSGYVTCSDGSSTTTGSCPDGSGITGPVLLYLQSATVPGVPPTELGRQAFETTELGLFLQDTWRPDERLSLDLGLRWDGSWHPDVFVEPEDAFFAPYLDDPAFPSDGRIPDDLDNFQPRLGVAWDIAGDGSTVVRAAAGSYVARIPMLVFAQHRSTNGAFQQTLFRASADTFLGPVPALDQRIIGDEAPFLPDIQVADRDLELPRTWSFHVGLDHDLGHGIAASASYIHARTDQLFRFVNRNDPAFGSPFGVGTHPGGGGINALTVAESSARSRYHALTLGVRGWSTLRNRPLSFEAHYTLGFDRSDDDNERDPFTLRYADASNLEPEFGWSDRDRRHQISGYLLLELPLGVQWSNVIRVLSASPVSEQCATPGQRANQPSDRICPDGAILERNTLRRDNAFFTWDLRLSRRIPLPSGAALEPVLEIFNLTNNDNFLDTATGSLLFNFDGSLRSGLGDTRRAQLGLTLRF